MPRRRAVIVLVGSSLLLLGGVLLCRDDAQAQVETAFTTLAAGFAAGDAQQVLSVADQDYDFGRHLGHLPGIDLGLSGSSAAAADEADQRRRWQRQLQRYFFLTNQRQTTHRLDWQVHQVAEAGAEITAVVSLELDGGMLPRQVRTRLDHYTFHLTSRGWLCPRARIADHDPLPR